MRATALRIRHDQPLPAEAGPSCRRSTCASPEGPTDALGGAMVEHALPVGLSRSRSVESARSTSPGPASIWYRASRPIVEGEPDLAADARRHRRRLLQWHLGLPVLQIWTFINADLTISLAREPVGEWILLDAETWAGPNSIGIASARLADRDGYFGRAVQSILFEKRS